MGAKTEKVQRESQATPLADDILQILRGQIAEGAFGQGVGPQQRQSGRALEQFINARQNVGPGGQIPDLGLGQVEAPSTAGQVADRTGQLIEGLTNLNRQQTNRSAADLREGFGIAGARFGTPLALGEARLRSDALAQLDPILGQIMVDQGAREQAARQFDVSSMLNAAGLNTNRAALGLEGQRNQLAMDNQLLNAIGQQFGMGQANLQPFMQFGGMGILPEEIIQTPNPWAQLGGSLLNAGAQFFGGPGGAQLFRGGGPASPQQIPGQVRTGGGGGMYGPPPGMGPIYLGQPA